MRGTKYTFFNQCSYYSIYLCYMQNRQRQSYAPFGSLASKNHKKKRNQILNPGPGQYQVSLPLIAPVVQTIRKQNNNIIVKLGHFGTAAFLDGADRFKLKQLSSEIGPGSYSRLYEEPNEKRLPIKHRKVAAEKLREIIQIPVQTIPSITEVKKVAFDDEIQMPSPEKKKKKNQRQGKAKGLNWSKVSQMRQMLAEKSQSKLGPGSYEVQKKKGNEKYPSYSFNSKSVRSFFDQIRFETNQDTKARQRLEKNYKSEDVGPGSYNTEQMQNHRKFQKYQFFGSTQQRK